MLPKIIFADEIASHLTFDRLIPAIAQGFRDFHIGRARVAAITNIDLPDVNGEMHIKPGYMVNGEHLCVKIATCYYDNPRKGLPTRDGAVVVASRTHGRIEAVLCDSGLITDMRTAAASAVAVDVLARPGPITLGLVGSGTQAYWHARALSHVRRLTKIVVWGRSRERVESALHRISAATRLPVASGSLDDAAACDVIVTATPAKAPVLNREALQPGALLVAMGADAIGKRELGAGILDQASTIVADSLDQCRVIGELQWLKTTGAQARVVELGAVVSEVEVGRRAPDEIVVFDSTGLAFQDVVGAAQILEAIRGDGTHG